jgi:hypothetical protein
MFKPFRTDNRMTSQSGSILTAAMGVVVLVGTLSYTAYSLLSGPVRSAAIVTLKTKAQNELILGAKLIMRAAADTDADLVMEPPTADMTVTAVASTNGGGIPLSIGAEKIDPWSVPYAYCGWNHGGTNSGVAGLLDGDMASYDGLLTIALISAGPNRTFETVCNNALGTITSGGDDVVMRYTYEQAVSIELWKESSTPGAIETSSLSQSVGIGKTADPLYKLDVLGNSMMAGNLSVTQAIDANSLTAGTVDINGGTIDNTSIGGAVRSSGAFTTLNSNSGTSTVGLTATGTISLSGTGTINGLSVGATTASTGRFTNLTWTGTLTPPNSTLISNLNADLLDGQHGAFYQDASNLNAGTLPVARTPAYQGDVAKVQGDDYTFIESFQGYALKINPAPAADQVMGWDSSNKVWKPMQIKLSDSGGDSDTIGVGGVNILATEPDMNSCANMEIPKFSGGEWKCGIDLTGITSIVLSGDVTGTGSSSIATTIANDAVTFAKMQNIPTASLIGRYTAATGDPQSITLGAGLALSGGGVLSATGGVSTGTTVTGGNPNSVLYLNGSGQLSTSSNFTYDTSTQVFTIGVGYIGLTVDMINKNYFLGDSGSNTRIDLSGSLQTVGIGAGGTLALLLDGVNKTYQIGSTSTPPLGNTTLFKIDDANRNIRMSARVNPMLESDVFIADAANNIYGLGDIQGGTGTFFGINVPAGEFGFVYGGAKLMTVGPGMLTLDYLIGQPGMLVIDPFGGVASTTMPVGLTDGDKGDITVSASGATWTIDNNVVTFAKMQDIATASLMGRTTAGSGDPELITVGSGLTLSAGTLSANAVGVSDGDKGDITVSGSGATWTLDNDTVTLAKLQNIATTSLIGRSTAGAGDPEVITVGTGLTLAGGTLSAVGSGGAATWGAITGTLSDQTDLQTALDNKVTKNADIVSATKTKITYDVKGLVTAGADATTADIADSTDRRYVTDAQLAVIGNTSGTNTGDQTITLTGDVTGTGTGSFATTIANNTVTFAKMQDIATARLIGRSTAGAGDPELISIGSGLSLAGGILSASSSALSIGDPVAGSTANAVIYVDGANNLANSSAFTYDGNALISGSGKNFLYLDHSGQIYKIGDIDGNKNFTHMVIDDGNKAISLQSGGKSYFLVDITNGSYKIGDLNGTGSGSVLAIDDPGKIMLFSPGGSAALSLDSGNGVYKFGEVSGTNNGMIIQSDDPNEKFDFFRRGSSIFTVSAAGLTAPPLGDGSTTRMLTVNAGGTFGATAIPNALTDGDKGDITVSASGATWTIDNDVVSFAKMQNIATTSLIGRSTAGTGDPEVISIGSGLSLAGGTLSATGGGSGTVTSVNITQPAAGITATGGPITTSGSITLALADDLAAVEGLSTNGMVARTASNTWTTRTITAGDASVSVTNGDGVSGNPTLSIARTINTQTGTTYTLLLSDAQKVVELNNASTVTVTIPANATVAFPVGTFIDFVQYGAGQVTLSPAGGVTLRSFASSVKTAGQYAVITAYKRAADEWVITGNTE